MKTDCIFRYALCGLMAAGMLAAQGETPVPPATITGPEAITKTTTLTVKVIDSGTGAPVPDAAVSLMETGSGDRANVVSGAVDCMTGADGACHLSVNPADRYRVFNVQAEGYYMRDEFLAPPGTMFANTSPVGIDGVIETALTRAVTLKGRVLDADSGDPVSGLPVQPLMFSFAAGRPEALSYVSGVPTDKDGKSEIRDIRPGRYVLELNGTVNSVTAPDGHLPVDKKYRWQEWPGGGEFSTVTPLAVPSGTTMDVGAIRISRHDPQTITFRIAGDCRQSGYYVVLSQSDVTLPYSRARMYNAKCGVDNVLEGISPGSYRISATPEGSPGFPLQLADSLVVVGSGDEAKDTKVELTLRPPLKIRGRVVMKDADPSGTDAVRPVTKGSILLSVGRGIPRAGNNPGARVPEPDPSPIGSDGSFGQAIYVLPGGRVSVDAINLPAGLFVDSVLYNGHTIAGDEFILNETTSVHDLEILCSDQSGAINGEITSEKGKPHAVLLAPWPNDGVEYPYGVVPANAGPDGKFSVSQIRPGKYRAVAVEPEEREGFENPFRLMNALSSGTDVSVGTGANSVIIGAIAH